MRSSLLFLLLGCLICFASANNITAYQSKVHSIFQAAIVDTTGYDRVGQLCNTFGPRFSGSESLESAIDWVVATMKSDGFDSVTTESVSVPTWVRRKEFLELKYPRKKTMDILTLGGSIATPSSGITAQVLVVRNFDELEAKANQVEGKIVVYNQEFVSYSQSKSYRTRGASEAAKLGAIASLTRSVTPFSLYTPHTGAVVYEDGVKQIPAASLTVEDAELLQSLQDSGKTPVLTLFLDCETLADSPSRNVIAEYVGSELPEEIVVIGGHIDSWDITDGAHDDAGGVVQTWEAVRLMKSLGLRPRRTIRVVAWTNEENGGAGNAAYFNYHKNELNNTVFCFESDSGSLTPVGFRVTGTDDALLQIRKIAELMEPYVHLDVVSGSAGADVTPLTNAGVPGVGLEVAAGNGFGLNNYFWYHHTKADTFAHIDLEQLQLCTGSVASLAYVIADMDFVLPRTPVESH